MNVILINPYELGRQPFGLAHPATWLIRSGFQVTCIDLTIQRLDPVVLSKAQLICIYVAMHTATRIALEALPRIQASAPNAYLCVYGLYAPMNAAMFQQQGVNVVLDGEPESDMLTLAKEIQSGQFPRSYAPSLSIKKIEFVNPERSMLPALSKYANLVLPGERPKTIAFVEASRGCKHLCRHCPVVPVYNGTFRAVPVDVVLMDIRQQIAAGAEHVSFGDPDFLNGPTHAKRIIQAMHAEFPQITYDVTIKVEHLLQKKQLLPTLKKTGCLFITSAIESVNNEVLRHLNKNHTDEDFAEIVKLLHDVGIALAPTFVAFNPWITLDGYIALLRRLVELELVESVPPIQLAIRLLVPLGSHLLNINGFKELLGNFDPVLLGYPWQHSDPRVDRLQRNIQHLVEQNEQKNLSRRETFEQVWQMAHNQADKTSPTLPTYLGKEIPCHSENWYCCAEPTSQQLMNF